MADPPRPDPFALQPIAPQPPAPVPPQQPAPMPLVINPPATAWVRAPVPYTGAQRKEIQHSPGFRNLVHCGMFFGIGLPLLFLGKFLVWWGWTEQTYGYCVAALGFIATLFNAFILRRTPVLGKLIMRPDEHIYNGVWIYPCALAVCFLLFSYFGLYAPFAAWAVMACGDAAASYFGRMLPAGKLQWNKNKTYAGFIAFFSASVFGVYITLYLMPCKLFLDAAGWPELKFVWTLSVLASMAGAIAESIDTKIDDNARVPFAAAGMLVLGAYFLKFSTQNMAANTHIQPENFIHAMMFNAALGFFVLLFRFADFPATLLGMMLGTMIYFYAGWQGYTLFVLFVGLGSTLSRIGLARKKELHTEEANEGKRGVGNVVANLLVASVCCLAYPVFARASLLVAFAGAIAAALADTASSEIGVLSRKDPWLVTTFKPVKHGTNGAISMLGSISAFAASGLVAGIAVLTGFLHLAAGQIVTWPGLLAMSGAIFCGGVFGTAIDSVLGATVEGKAKGLGKGTVNFICTLVGAITAGAVAEIWMWFSK